MNDKEKIKQLELEIKELRKSKQMLENIINSVPGHVYWLDRNQIILGCNKQQVLDAGFSSSVEMIGKTNAEMPWKERSQELKVTNNKVMKSGKALLFEEVSKGKNKVYLSEKAPLRNENNEIIGIVGISLDITKHKKQEQMLLEQKQKAEKAECERLKHLEMMTQLTLGKKAKRSKSSTQQMQDIIDYLENIIALMPGHVYWLDRDNTILGCNDNQAKTLGLNSRHEIIGKTIADFQSPQNTKATLAINNEVMSTGIPHVAEEQAYLADHSGKGVFLSYKKPLYDKNHIVIGLLGISLDITNRKKMENKLAIAKKRAETANIAKTEFIANISHDIRTPLSGIIGMAQLLHGKVKTKQQAKYVEHVLAAAQQLLRILNEVLEFSAIDSGKLPIRNEEFNLKEIAENTAQLLQDKKNNVRIVVSYPTNIPHYVIGDSLRLNRIILNLLSNALKFTEQGYVKLSFHELEKNKTSLKLQMIIEDTGVGIPDDKISSIFERFARVSATYKGAYQGTGLGLSIVKQFIDELGGTISVQSRIDVGTKFICEFSFMLPCKRRTHKSNTQNRLQHVLQSVLHVLLIEDDNICQLVEKKLLEDIGCKVELAETGAQALALAAKKFDIIISDIGLPDIDGLQLAKQIRAQFQHHKNTPIIALTAHVSKDKTQRYLKHGINKVLHKPMDKTDIQKQIATLKQHD